MLERDSRGRAAAHRPPASGSSGASAFEEVFSSLQEGGPGYHPIPRRRRGGGAHCPRRGPTSSATSFTRIDAVRSIANALKRTHGELQLAEEDLEVYETEHLTSCATVVAIDICHSMILYGEDRITPAKTVALALTELITTKYPKDHLGVIMFGDRAARIEPADIAVHPGGPVPHQHPRGAAAGARDAGEPQAAQQADLPDHRRQALGDHRGTAGSTRTRSGST